MNIVNTFVRTILKDMVYRKILTPDQVAEAKSALLAKKIMNKAALQCEHEHICTRGFAYIALNPKKYDGTNVIHRNVLDAAVRLLNIHGVYFEWAEDVSLATT